MAGPFVQFPSFAEYIAWARDKHNCTINSGYMASPNGRMNTTVRILAPNGKWTVEVMGQDERLTPSIILRLDRRLGLQSSFLDPED